MQPEYFFWPPIMISSLIVPICHIKSLHMLSCNFVHKYDYLFLWRCLGNLSLMFSTHYDMITHRQQANVNIIEQRFVKFVILLALDLEFTCSKWKPRYAKVWAGHLDRTSASMTKRDRNFHGPRLQAYKFFTRRARAKLFFFFSFSSCGWHDLKFIPVLLESLHQWINRSVNHAPDKK